MVAPMLARLDQPVAVMDASWCHAYENRAFLRLVGADASTLVGAGPPPPYLGAVGLGELTAATTVELRRVDGSIIPVVATLHTPTLDGTRVLGRFVIVSESPVADRETGAQRRLRRIERQLDEISTQLRLIDLERDRVADPVSFPGLRRLSRREWEVLEHLLRGRRVPTIAEQLFVSQNTVRNHLKSIFRKLGVSSQAELLELVTGLRGQRLSDGSGSTGSG